MPDFPPALVLRYVKQGVVDVIGEESYTVTDLPTGTNKSKCIGSRSIGILKFEDFWLLGQFGGEHIQDNADMRHWLVLLLSKLPHSYGEIIDGIAYQLPDEVYNLDFFSTSTSWVYNSKPADYIEYAELGDTLYTSVWLGIGNNSGVPQSGTVKSRILRGYWIIYGM